MSKSFEKWSREDPYPMRLYACGRSNTVCHAIFIESYLASPYFDSGMHCAVYNIPALNVLIKVLLMDGIKTPNGKI